MSVANLGSVALYSVPLIRTLRPPVELGYYDAWSMALLVEACKEHDIGGVPHSARGPAPKAQDDG